ncbi:type IV pilin N-terminal domain-containing protein [Halorhabdus rudnickae]|uniref:type IV pilin N-terminal domain-containing protein n=1 Tax=Halorhabdus rudnickae TaxID=1775544 RepID=UPI001082BA98|nr:type IV pilin N-terminal domain-containing protein [Halorhabdus rudnickae]
MTSQRRLIAHAIGTEIRPHESNCRAQSEVIGVILFTAVVVTLTVLVGATILGTVDTGDKPVTNLRAEVDASELTLSHHGGSTLDPREVSVVLRDGAQRRLALDEFGGGDRDGMFAPGGQLNYSHRANGTLRVLVVHNPSNTILYDRVLDVPERALSNTDLG